MNRLRQRLTARLAFRPTPRLAPRLTARLAFRLAFRLALALAGAVSLVLGLLLLPAAAYSAAAGAAGAAGGAATASAGAAAGGGGPVTVLGPQLWNPAAQRKFSRRASVTVSQTANLVDQEVHVTWTGFTPSSRVLYDAAATDYPVMVAECNSPRPRFWSQCYGANNGGVEGSFGPFGPMNTAYATTAATGSGELDIQILTQADNQLLGCSSRHACSLVIVPSQGGNVLAAPPNCADHSQDTGGADVGQFAFSNSTGSCSWQDRIVVPLRFAPAPANCPIRNANFTAIGSPMLSRAMDQWRAGLCTGSSPLAISYDSAITEPAAITAVQGGLGDIALTTRPGPDLPGRHYVYAPVAVSAVSVAYWVDDPVTGRPVRNLRLSPRLLAKLLTQSYNFQNEGCGRAIPLRPKIGCDGAVDGNPFSLFDDPEFTHLNPRVQSPAGFGSSFQVPTVQSGHSDMTYTVTRWIAADPAAAGFMQGVFDPWGMHVNTDYLSTRYPVDSFTGQDSYPVIAHKFSPVFPLSAVATYQAENWDPGTDWETDQYGNFPKDPVSIPGERGLFAVLDEAAAAAYRFPVAAILNHSGHYAQPSAASMRAALAPGGSATQQVDLGSAARSAYPLTMVIYAMVPTSGTSAAHAAAIARFLRFAAGPGQVPGTAPGQLPAGYLPLPARLRAQTLAAAAKVADQSGRKPGPARSPSPTPSPSPSTGPATSPSTGAIATSLPVPSAAPLPKPAPTVTLPVVRPRLLTVAVKNPPTAGVTRFALPALLILGGLAALAGASSLVAGTSGAAIGRRARRLRAAGSAWWRRHL